MRRWAVWESYVGRGGRRRLLSNRREKTGRFRVDDRVSRFGVMNDGSSASWRVVATAKMSDSPPGGEMPLQFMLFFLLSASLWALWVQSRCWTVCQGKESFELLCLCLRRSWPCHSSPQSGFFPFRGLLPTRGCGGSP